MARIEQWLKMMEHNRKMLRRGISIAIISIFSFSQFVQAQGLSKSDCGSAPAQFAQNEFSDTKTGGGFSGIFKQAAANGNYEKAVQTTRQAVYAHYPDAKALGREQYADYISCVLIVTDPTLNGEGKRKAWNEYEKSKSQPVSNQNDNQDVVSLGPDSIGKWVVQYNSMFIEGVSPVTTGRSAFGADLVQKSYIKLTNQGEKAAILQWGTEGIVYHLIVYGFDNQSAAARDMYRLKTLSSTLGDSVLEGSVADSEFGVLNLELACPSKQFTLSTSTLDLTVPLFVCRQQSS